MINLDKTQLIYNINNNYLPHIALSVGHYDLFFYLMDKIVKTSNEKIIFASIVQRENQSYTLTHEIILKKNNELLNKYIDRYAKFIDWSQDNKKNIIMYLNSIIYNHIINNEEDFSNINTICEKIISSNKYNLTDLFYSPGGFHPLFLLLDIYYNLINNISTDSTKTKSNLNTDILFKLMKHFINLYPIQINYMDFKNRTPIYIIAENNDIKLLDFCIKCGADLNHNSYYGYNSFCHNLVKLSNYEMIKFVLSQKINMNFINSYNETPIFNLLETKFFISDDKTPDDIAKKQYDIISELLIKTDNWDLQNVYGQTIIHLLANRSDIKSYYNILWIDYHR